MPRRDAVLRSYVSSSCKPLFLRVSIHILEIRQLFHLRKQNGPQCERSCTLSIELCTGKRGARSSADAKVLGACKKAVATGSRFSWDAAC